MGSPVPIHELKLTRATHRKDASDLPNTLQQTRQRLRSVNAQSNVDGSRRLRPIGSGVHHFDGDFFTREQVADVPDQSLSVDRDNVERHGLRLRRIRPGRSRVWCR